MIKNINKLKIETKFFIKFIFMNIYLFKFKNEKHINLKK